MSEQPGEPTIAQPPGHAPFGGSAVNHDDAAAEDAIAAALGNTEPSPPQASPPAAVPPPVPSPADAAPLAPPEAPGPEAVGAAPPEYAGAASMAASDDFFVGGAGGASRLQLDSEPAGAVEENVLVGGHHESPEAADLLHHTERDFEVHGDFEADEIAVQAAHLPGRSAPGSRRRVSILRRLGWGFWIAGGWVVLMILVAVFAKLLPLSSDTLSTCIPNSGPAGGHLLGCDEVGRDVLSRVIFGSQVSLVVGFASIALALVVGGTMAVISGYLRGILDSLFGIATNVILAYPYLILGLAIVTFWGHSEFQVTIFIAIVAVAPLYRIVRANTIAFAERDYVLAATALGSTRRRVLLHQIVPDVIPTGITYGLVGVAIAVVGEGALSFLGQSVRAPTPTWGNMIAEGSGLIPSMGTTPVNLWIVLGPAIAMFLFILAINLIGDRLRSILDVREGVL